MRLQEYIEERQISKTTFAANCGLTFHQIFHILNGGSPTLKTAIIIKKETSGRVQPEDLLPLEDLVEVQHKHKKKTKGNK